MNFNLITVDLETALKTADMVTLHVPGAKGGALLGAKELGLMKQGALLVNAARGGVVDEAALLQALDSGHIAGAGLDVFVNEPTPAIQVLMHPKVSVTPHIGAATEEAQDRIGEEIASIIIERASSGVKS